MFKDFKRFDTELRWSAKLGCFTRYNAATRSSQAVANDPFLVDFGTVQRGWERWRKGQRRETVVDYINNAMPVRPGVDFKSIGIVPIMHADWGRCIIIVDDEMIAAAFDTLSDTCIPHERFKAGDLPAVRLIDGRFEIMDWVERNEKQLGQRIVSVAECY